MPGTREQSSLERPSLQSRRKRPRKRSPRIQVEGLESTASPLEGGAPRVAPASGAPVLKRRRELGALLVNGSGPPVLAWPAPQREGPPASPADRGDCPATLPPGEKLKKSGGPSGLDLYNSCAQKAAILKKRKKMKEMSNSVEPRGMKLVPALVRQGGLPGRSVRAPPPQPQARGQSDPGPGAVMAPNTLYQGVNSDLSRGLPVPPLPLSPPVTRGVTGPALDRGTAPMAQQAPHLHGVNRQGAPSRVELVFLLQLLARPGLRWQEKTP